MSANVIHHDFNTESLRRERELLQQQVRDVSSQVKVLLMEQHIRESGQQYSDEEMIQLRQTAKLDSTAFAEMSDTGRFISENLTTFRSIAELQAQNTEILRYLRELGEQMESNEAREKEQVHQKEHEELEALRVRVASYKDELQSMVAQFQSYVKERDMFRNMLTRHGHFLSQAEPGSFAQSMPLPAGSPSQAPMDSIHAGSIAGDETDYAKLLRDLQTHFDSYKQEFADNSALRNQITELSKRNSQLQNQTESLEAELQVTKRKLNDEIKKVTKKDGSRMNASTKTAAKEAVKPLAEPEPTTKSKRKAAEEPIEPTINGMKRRRASKDSVEAPSPKGKKTTVASKRPRTVKHKVAINEAPTRKLNVYVFGTGDNGELGLGSEKGQITVKRPRLNSHLAADTVGVVHMAVGGSHCAALTHDNRILTWGVNDEGALGRDVTWEAPTRDIDEKSDGDSDDDSETGINPKEAIPTAIDMSVFPEGTIFTQLAAGDSMTFALTDEGLVYGWGTFRGNEGVIGFRGEKGEIVRIAHQPILVDGLKKITKLACGSNHVLALASNGAVYAWGSGQQHQLGRRTVERTKHNALTPREFGLPKGTVDIGAGSYHSFAVNQNGKVYAWGLNSYGETGVRQGAGEDEAVILHPTAIDTLKEKGKITCIKGGAHHSVAVNDAGHCLVWGRVDGCQSGLDISTLPEDHLIRDSKKNPRILSVPTRVPGFEAVYATAGSDHCIAISKDGTAYSWGFSETYQTGQGQDDEVEIATQIDNTTVKGKHLVWAGAGGQFSAVAGLADEGKSDRSIQITADSRST